MSALAEIAIAMITFLIEVTIQIVLFAVAPLRFLISARFRQSTGEQWQGHPTRCALQLTGGTLALFLLAGALAWWVDVFTRPEPSPTARVEWERRILEKVPDFRNSRQ